MTLRRSLGLGLAGVMILVGAVWTGQGLGWIGGSSMTGETFWAVVGPIVAGLGVALVIVIIGNARRQRGQTALDERYGGRR
jgi:apolipoprotein N-acyltransferase